MAITVYVGDNNNTARKEQKAYVGYNDKAVEIFSEPLAEIYGAVWDGSATTAWTRTDSAKNFSAPNPYYAGMSGTPSSPFDNIMPWKGMTVSDDSNAGKVVAIPKFYYKMGYASGTTGLKIQISMAKHDGFKCSPAHMDRGDGAGERDVVYVGRYHCASDYKSKTGVTPKNNITKSTFRSGISALGANVWQWDYAMLATIHMLYLVEFAHWDSQRKIGYGCGNNSGVQSMGYTDAMPYHTGTSLSSKTAYGLGTQYRHIEGLWDNCYDFVDGFIFSSSDIYIIKNPAYFSDDISDGVFIGSRAANGYTQAMAIPTVSGYEWAIYPSAIGGSDSTYICDFNDISGGSDYVTGGYYSQYLSTGFFYMSNRSNSGAQYGSRLMVLP